MDISSFKDRLTARQGELSIQLQRIEADLSSPVSADSEEQAIEREGDEVLEERSDVDVVELSAIKAALERIERGQFGICTRCGKKISTERLNAVPQAALCMDCINEIDDDR